MIQNLTHKHVPLWCQWWEVPLTVSIPSKMALTHEVPSLFWDLCITVTCNFMRWVFMCQWINYTFPERTDYLHNTQMTQYVNYVFIHISIWHVLHSNHVNFFYFHCWTNTKLCIIKCSSQTPLFYKNLFDMSSFLLSTKMVSSKSASDSTVDVGKRDRCSWLFGALGKTSVL